MWDELWGGVKVQSNREIACSHRNNFRVSLKKQLLGVELLDAWWALPGYPMQPNSEYQ